MKKECTDCGCNLTQAFYDANGAYCSECAEEIMQMEPEEALAKLFGDADLELKNRRSAPR